MDSSSLQGMYFGLTEGTVTTLGIIIGMLASIPSKKAIFSAVIAASLSDSFGDSIGLYYSEEVTGRTQGITAVKNMVFFKLLMATLYLAPLVIFKNLKTGIYVSIILALIVISLSFYNLALIKEINTTEFVIKNTMAVGIVVLITYYVVSTVERFFK
jgi:VIT1/CCC1 family predicted Fe2+/Mn2+ transporter